MNTRDTAAQPGFMQTLTDSMTPKFAISYIRVSDPRQAERGGGNDEGFSIPAQREAIKRKAHSMGAIIGKEFVDRGTSAKSADRPELQKMMDYIKENKDRVYCVIVHKVDRLARNRGDDADITRALQGADIELVSVSEGIDYTPSGMLLHGVLSSVAEFYSNNLSTEVKKGMSQKVKSGGTPTKAPLGYRNIRDYDERGRRDSRVEIDTERAPLVELAFREYATGNWSLSSLAEHLADLGLATPTTPKLPSKPIAKKMLHMVLINPYYKGIVTYNGAQYQGKHTPIIDETTWDKVQEILKSHVNGERERVHDHYLKSTVYCGKCGARLIIHNAKSRSGDRYPYFVCAAKHSKRNDCRQRSLLIDEIADKIEELYARISFTAEFRGLLRQWMTAQIDKLADESKVELERLAQQKEKLEREQRKLLQAHYEDAVPLPLLKEEQERIGKSLKSITELMDAYRAEYTKTAKNMNDVFELMDDCGRAYKLAGDFERRCFNQALFKRILVYEDLALDVEYAEPFDAILVPEMFLLKGEFENRIQSERNGQPESAAHLSSRNFLSAANTKTDRKIADFFTAGLSMDILVQAKRT
jgi:DNA invertase Pin-like site-specific DNA recombinase